MLRNPCVGAGESMMRSRRSQQALLRWLGLVLFCGALGVSPREAFAQETPPDEAAQARDQEARRLFEAGRAAYVEEKYQDALNYFQQSHEMSGRPQLLFNVGQAADRVGQRETAAQAFRDYLAAVPDAENRAEVEARIAELESDGTVSSSTLTVEAERDQAAGRDGLYLRGGVGLGVFSDSFNRNLGAGVEATASGATFATEGAIGYAVQPGLVIAAFMAMEWAQASKIEAAGVTRDDASVGVLLMLGAMVDWYLKPHRGWHLQGGLAVGRLSVQGGDSDVIDHTPVGGALLLGGGHEWPLDGKLAIGVLGRLTVSQLKGDEFTHNVGALSVLCSLTFF